MFSLLRDIYRSEPRGFVRMVLLSVLVSLSGGVSVLLLVPLLQCFDIQSGSRWAVLNRFLPNVSGNVQLACILGVFVLAMVCKALLNRHVQLLHARLTQDYMTKLRLRLYKAVSQADWQHLIRFRRSDLLNLFHADCTRISNAAIQQVQGISLLMTAAVQIAIALVMNVPLTLFVLVSGGGFFLAFRPMMRRSKQCGQSIRSSALTFFAEIDDQISGMKEIRSYGIQQAQSERFRDAAELYRANYLELTRLTALPAMIYTIGSAVLVALAFFFAQAFLSVSAGQLIVIVYIFSRLWPVYTSLQSILQNVMTAVPVYQAMEETEHTLSQSACIPQPETAPLTLHREIRLSDVSFAYEGADVPLMEHLELSVPACRVTALVGRSGAGKSTLVDLITGFLTPSAGQIRIDDTPLTPERMDAWRKCISYVPQEPLLLNGTVRENILRFHPELTEEQLIRALQRAQAWDFVQRLPQGMDTFVGDRGVRLSGGERQRIVLARALASNPALLVLDEATASLDYENEYLIRQVLRNLDKHITVLLIAHRISTIRSADHIIVLENGKIRQQGSFAELLAQPDSYLARMLEME